MGKIFRNFKWYEYLLILLNVAIVVTQVYFEMELIDKMAELIGKVQAVETVASIWRSGRMMLLYAGIIMVASIASAGLVTYISSKFAERLRADVFRTVNGFSQEEINKFSTASLITRSTNDVTQIQTTMQMVLRAGIMAPTMTIFSIINMVNSSAQLSWTTGISVIVMFVLFGLLFFLVVPAFNKIQKQTDRLNSVTRENLTGVRVVRAYNTEKLQEEKFDGVNKELTKLNLYTGRVMSMMNPFMNLIFNGLTLAIYWLGAHLINTTSLVYSDLVAFTQYGMHILMGFMFLSMISVML